MGLRIGVRFRKFLIKGSTSGINWIKHSIILAAIQGGLHEIIPSFGASPNDKTHHRENNDPGIVV